MNNFEIAATSTPSTAVRRTRAKAYQTQKSNMQSPRVVIMLSCHSAII